MNEGAKKCVAQKHHVRAINEHSKGAEFWYILESKCVSNVMLMMHATWQQ